MLYKYSCADHQHGVMNISDDYFTIKLYRYARLVYVRGEKKSERERMRIQIYVDCTLDATLPKVWFFVFLFLHRTHWPFEETTNGKKISEHFHAHFKIQ